MFYSFTLYPAHSRLNKGNIFLGFHFLEWESNPQPVALTVMTLGAPGPGLASMAELYLVYMDIYYITYPATRNDILALTF